MDSFVLLGILAALVLLMRGERLVVRGRAWSWLRVLLPSWRFFDRVAPVPRLLFRAARSDAELERWQPVVVRAPRSFSSLALNPCGNLLLAYHTLLEQLIDDLSELEADDAAAAERLVSYELTANLVRVHLREHVPSAARFQFKITLTDVELREQSAEDVLISRIHAI